MHAFTTTSARRVTSPKHPITLINISQGSVVFGDPHQHYQLSAVLLMSRRLAHDSSEYASLHSLYPIQCRVEPRVQLKVHPASRYPSVAPVWLVFYKRLCTHPPFRSLVLALPEVRVAFYHTLAPSHTSAFCSVMPSGTVATVPGSGADAPRSVWAGIIFVRIFPLLPRVSPNSDHRPPADPLRRIWRYPHWI